MLRDRRCCGAIANVFFDGGCLVGLHRYQKLFLRDRNMEIKFGVGTSRQVRVSSLVIDDRSCI